MGRKHIMRFQPRFAKYHVEQEILINSGALVADLLAKAKRPMTFEKLHHYDPRGPYGSYVVSVDAAEAEQVLRRYSALATAIP